MASRPDARPGAVDLPLTAALVTLATRVLDRRTPTAKPAVRFGRLAIISFVGIVCHVLMDLPTSYGVRLLSPFDWHWFTTDWMPIVDLYLLVALAAGLLYGRGSVAARQRNVIIVSVLVIALYAMRAAGHHQALGLAPRAFGPLLPEPCAGAPAGQRVIARWPTALDEPSTAGVGRCLVDIAALPTFISPFEWRLIAQMSNGYVVQDVNLFGNRLRDDDSGSRAPWRTSVRYPNQWNPEVFRAANAGVGRVFLGFSRLPAARSLRARDGFVNGSGPTCTVPRSALSRRPTGELVHRHRPFRQRRPGSGSDRRRDTCYAPRRRLRRTLASNRHKRPVNASAATRP
jgi:hypothetical protein